eukprot:GAFH01000175.1.p1 GENE.GAFH01000175.1~~GAFH01000175.1.p1  ORF type:complete len:304 (-),score=25.68 GAFH01000175.1:372-1283(-)
MELASGLLDTRDYAVFAPHLRRLAIYTDSTGPPLPAMPRLVDFKGPDTEFPKGAWETLERATMLEYPTPRLSLSAPRLRHLTLPQLERDLVWEVRLDCPGLETLELPPCMVDQVEAHCTELRSLTVHGLRQLPLWPWKNAATLGRFNHLQTLTVDHLEGCDYPIPEVPTIEAFFQNLAPNLTTLKGIVLPNKSSFSLLADLCSGALLPHLAHLEATTTITSACLTCSPALRVLRLGLHQVHPREVLQMICPGLVSLRLNSNSMPPLDLDAPWLRDCRLVAQNTSPGPVRLVAPILGGPPLRVP